MKTSQAGTGLQHVYKTEEELRKAAEKAGKEVFKGHGTLFFHSGSNPINIHLYNENLPNH